MARQIDTATAYYDVSDPNNHGWAFRIRFEDGDQESGPMDAATDANGEALDELQKLVADAGGEWDAGTWEFRDGGEGSYVWTAP
jgi:DNA-directed RNA polymerase subunit L